MSKKLFIHATNVHQGGGLKLLTAIIKNLPGGVRLFLSLDDRLPLTNIIPEDACVKRVRPSILNRLLAEISLAKNALSNDVVFCFGNLPPLFKLRSRVVVYVQNRYLIDDVNLEGFLFKIKLRLMTERIWFYCLASHVDEFIVQTPSMKSILDARIKKTIPVSVIPFVSDLSGYNRKTKVSKKSKDKVFDFLYVASGEPHKNHRKLIDAWCLLADEGLYPSLKLTLDNDNFKDLCNWIIKRSRDYQLIIENKGILTPAQLKFVYKKASALIYPSKIESFGMPLIEARQAGLPVLASELDYVRDVIDPEQSFDPESAISIARAVKRFIGEAEAPLPLKNVAGLMRHLLDKST